MRQQNASKEDAGKQIVDAAESLVRIKQKAKLESNKGGGELKYCGTK